LSNEDKALKLVKGIVYTMNAINKKIEHLNEIADVSIAIKEDGYTTKHINVNDEFKICLSNVDVNTRIHEGEI